MDRETIEKLQAELKRLERSLENLSDESGEDFERSARSKIASIQNQLASIYNRARKTSVKAKNYVEENPWQAVGIAVLAGLVTGMIIGRKSKND